MLEADPAIEGVEQPVLQLALGVVGDDDINDSGGALLHLPVNQTYNMIIYQIFTLLQLRIIHIKFNHLGEDSHSVSKI
jgi:hypothetical protein